MVALGVACFACATPRYLSRQTRDGSFVHPGFGLYIHLGPDAPWRLVRDQDPDVPWTLWPQRVDGALDLDGDGRLETEEVTSREAPTARLVSRTSTAVRVDVQVEIAEPARAGVSVERMVRALQARGDPALHRRTVTEGWETWVGLCPECPEPENRLIAMVDHSSFVAEAGRRRQLVTFRWIGPEIGSEEADRFEALLDRVVLRERAGMLP